MRTSVERKGKKRTSKEEECEQLLKERERREVHSLRYYRYIA
jgi:hypothetical protein